MKRTVKGCDCQGKAQSVGGDSSCLCSTIVSLADTTIVRNDTRFYFKTMHVNYLLISLHTSLNSVNHNE